MTPDFLRRIVNRIMILFAVMLLFAVSVEAVEELKVSRRNGGVQYWWEVEDFDERDDAVFFLNDEKGHAVDDLKGASGDSYLVHNSPNPPNNLPPAEDVFFVRYTIDIDSGGTYFAWVRASWDRTPSGRANNSFFIQVNGTPDLGKFERHINTLGDATWLDAWEDDNPWTWIGDSAQPQALQGQAGGGLQNGLKTRFDAGENTVMIYHREGALTAQTMCSDVLMISTVDFMPTDEDFATAVPLSVQPRDKLTTTWARMKTVNYSKTAN